MKVLETKIYETKDYDLFVSAKTNRNVSKSHVAKLSKSLMERNLMVDNPILVTEKMDGQHYIIDGQHRLDACIENELPVWYRIAKVSTPDDVKILNVLAKKWTSADYLHFYVEKKKQDYLKFSSFFKWSGLRSVDACIKLFSGRCAMYFETSEQTNLSHAYSRGANSSSFKNGSFKYPSDDTEQRQHIENIKALAQGFHMEKWDNVSLWSVYFNVLLNTPLYEQETMLSQLAKYPVVEFKNGFPNASTCVTTMEDVYNKGVRFQKQFRFNRNRLG